MDDQERSYQSLLAFEPFRKLIWEMVGFTAEKAEQNMNRLEVCMKRMDAKAAKR